MQTPWNSDIKAFEIMFSDEAEYTASVKGEKGTIECCVFPVETVDPFADSDSDSKIKSVSVLVRKHDWYFTQVQPAVGDVIKSTDGLRYKVAEIEDEQAWWRLLGRSV